jgi:hypothetical protein
MTEATLKRARELAYKWGVRYCRHFKGAYCEICTAIDLTTALDAWAQEARLEEAKWWHDFHCGERHRLKDCLCCQRIASLEQRTGTTKGE